jgi:single-stranded-DNA-specific exonuclease
LVEKHHRPVVVVSLDGKGGGRGSGRSIPGFDLLAGLEACSEHLGQFGGHRAAAGLELEEGRLDAFREAFAAHAAEVLGPEDLKRTERVDAIVGGASLGLDLAEELRQLAPFGMGNPGVRLLVPSARVRDVRAIGEGKHARFSLHSGAHRALGVAFGRSTLGVAEEDPVDVAVRLEVNRWNGAVEPQVVLRELYPRDSGGGALEAGEWWRRFELELGRDPERRPEASNAGDGGHQRRIATSTNAPAAVAGELSSSGESVLAVCADAELRGGMLRAGLELTDYAGVERSPGMCRDFTHVVLVDPPAFAHLEPALSCSAREGGYLHRVWGDAEWRFAVGVLDDHFAQRPTLIAAFRDLRDAGETSGEELHKALLGSGPHPRSPETAARCFRVLAELGLVHGSPCEGTGEVGVVSSESTDLERSAAFRAYSARHQEARQYLEGQRQP